MLPESSNQPWPPVTWQPHAADIATADAWYSGNVAELDATSTAGTGGRNPIARAWRRDGGGDTALRDAATVKAATRTRIHVPAAADVAATGADLLFGETPTFEMAKAHGETIDPAAVLAEQRLTELIGLDGWTSKLIEGAEISGALGGVFLRPLVDLTLVDHPILTVVHPDQAVPEFRHGHLTAVTFWQQWNADKGKVWRHLERHERGSIEHALYVGTVDQLGVRKDLADREETAGLVTDVTAAYGGGYVDLAAENIDRLLARYVPNALPNRRHRRQPVGRSDTAGCEHLLDALDETWTSWVRDIRLAKARLIVPDEYLDRHGRGQGATFDPDQELFSPLTIDDKAKDGITLVQFAIRVAEHEATARALFTQIVQTAGYSPQSFGMQGNGAQQTATEVDAREGRSEATTARKQEYWRRGLEHVAESMLMLDKAFCGGRAEAMRPVVVFPDAAEADLSATAATLNLIAMARAASTETRVRILNPHWTEPQVQAEVGRIQAEDGGVPSDDPTGGL